MIHGHYSDNDEVVLSDKRKGIIVRSLGHRVMKPTENRKSNLRFPDETRGPIYEVLINGKKVDREGKMEFHGDEYMLVEELADQSLVIFKG